ncbi:MAG TPA: LacI family transcriptional regulator [Ruminococcaceae bacterium]|mgnify:FL=1|nr:LacI family transcriptional regulator [Oscillospiraceae bacterium]
MNIKKTVALLTLVFFLIACLFGCAKTSDIGAEGKNVAIITKGSDSDFWDDMKSGALAAANEFNINVTVEGPESEEDCDTQNEMIENAVSRNVDVIILSAIDYEKNAPSVQNAIDNGIKVITVDSDVNVKGKELFIGTDNISAGEKAAKQAVELCKGQKSINIGIVNYSENTENGKQRLKGFTDYIGKIENAKIVDTVNIESNTQNATAGAKKLLEKHKDINVLIGFNEWSTLGAGYAINELNLKDKVYCIGFDSNISCIDMLENGDIDILIVQNPFSMGYLSVSKAFEILSGKKQSDRTVETDTYVVNRKNMFSPDIQKILFRFNEGSN